MAKSGRNQLPRGNLYRAVEAPRRRLPRLAWLAAAGLVLLAAGIALIARPASTGSASPAGAADASTAGQAAAGPRLAVNQERIDFGRVPLGRPVKASFKLTNTGSQPLQIEGKPQIQVLKGC